MDVVLPQTGLGRAIGGGYLDGDPAGDRHRREQGGADCIDALAISNQRETIVAWDAETGTPAGPAILWQCTRTARSCAQLIAAGHGRAVEAATGLAINPMFPPPKIAWVVPNRPEADALHRAGRLRIGTVDARLLWKLSGTSFATDHSNASRIQLFDTAKLAWSADLGAIFGAPTDCLPVPRPSDSRFGETGEGVTVLPAGIPIHAMRGDSHAALHGHGVRAPGVVKATYGTGSSLMTLTPERVASTHGVSGTIAWSDATGTHHALEGNIFVSAQAADFIGNLLGIGDARALSGLAQTVDDAGGVTFVPALSGLGAPRRDERATGTVQGMTHATPSAHLARAAFEAMQADIGQRHDALSADGGASANPFLLQLQADLLDRPVDRAQVEKVGALGAAAMAFAGLGPEVAWARASTRVDPTMPAATRAMIRDTWAEAIRHVKA